VASRKIFTASPLLLWGIAGAITIVGALGLNAVWKKVKPGDYSACYREIVHPKVGRLKARVDDLRTCIDFDPPRLMSGVWINEFEGQTFREGASSWIDPRICGTSTWIEIKWPEVEKIMAETVRPGELAPFVYRITFIGQRTRRRGEYGHFGMFDRLVVVNEIKSVERLVPPERPTYAQVLPPCGS
jgi:hypothetical protein